jgi:hypothetical protein
VEKGLIMATTTNISLNEPAYNSTSPTWDQPLNYNATILDAVLGNTTFVALTNSNVTLTSPNSTGTGQTQVMRIVATGSISANVSIIIPSGIAGRWIIYNGTTGSYTVTIASGGGGTTVSAPKSSNITVYSDGTNVLLDNDGLLKGPQTFTSVTTDTITAPSGTLSVTGNISPTGRITPRVIEITSITYLSWNSDSYDAYFINAQANFLTINIDTGSPIDGQKIIFRIQDNGTAQTINWITTGTNSFRAVGVILPTKTGGSGKPTYVGCIYNAYNSFWDVVAVTTQT